MLFAFNNEAVEILRYFVVKLQVGKAACPDSPFITYGKSPYRNLGAGYSLVLLVSHVAKILYDTKHYISLCNRQLCLNPGLIGNNVW